MPHDNVKHLALFLIVQFPVNRIKSIRCYKIKQYAAIGRKSRSNLKRIIVPEAVLIEQSLKPQSPGALKIRKFRNNLIQFFRALRIDRFRMIQ